MLIVCPRPLKGEAVQSWLLRAGVDNGLSPLWFHEHYWPRLCKQDVPKDVLLALDSLRRGFSSHHNARICPDCAREGRPILQATQKLPIDYCPLHDSRLLRCCTGCRYPFRWANGLPTHCKRCGMAAADMRTDEPIADRVTQRHQSALFNVEDWSSVRSELDQQRQHLISIEGALDAAAERLRRVMVTMRLTLSSTARRKVRSPGYFSHKSLFWSGVDHQNATEEEAAKYVSAQLRRHAAGRSSRLVDAAVWPTGWDHLDRMVPNQLVGPNG